MYKKIKDFNIDERIEGFFMIKSVEVKNASNGSQFLDLTLTDNTGDINAKMWDYNSEKDIYMNTTIVKVRGDISEWKGQKQLKIIKIRNIDENDDVKIEEFIQTAPLEGEDMYNSITAYIEGMVNTDIKRITEYIVDKNKEKLLYYPAAKKNHHAIRSGLLYHILRMLNVADELSKIYSFVDKDLLFAGVILHDMAKLEEMDSNELGIVSEYTREGQLLGHLIQGIKNISRAAEYLQIESEVPLLIEHMILSHHYHADYGSPKKPMIPEAELLHYIDTIDASMYDMEKSLKEIEENEFTEPIWSLDKRRIYKSSL